MLTEISIEIIRKCPNRCLHCSSFSSVKCTEVIPFDVFKGVIVGAKKLGLKTVCFSGGEPFLHPDIANMIDFVYEQGINSYVYSSGIYLNDLHEPEPIPENILAQISKKVSKIIFNIEAAEDETYNNIMGTEDCFNFLGESIRRTVRSGIIAEGHFVPNKLNINQIEPTLEYCAELGVSKVSFLRLVLHGRAKENKDRLYLSEKELLDVEIKLEKIKKANKYNIRIGVPLSGETEEIHCEAANGKLNIRYDGNVYPCEVFKNNQVLPLANCKPGNIYREPIDKIYYESEYLLKTRELINKHCCNHSCENCVGQFYMKMGV